MPIFKPGVPIETSEPVIVVENSLKPGRYRFQLVALDRLQGQSVPSIREVVVTGRIALRPQRRQAQPKRSRAKE